MKIARLLTIAAAAAIPILGLATPAQAVGPCWTNGAQMINSDCGRNTYILDPGKGYLLSRDVIWQHRDYYGDRGFSPNFIWYAYETDRVFHPNSDERWSGICVDATKCVVGSEVFHNVVDAFSDDERELDILLPSLTFGNGFIARTCGNYSQRKDNPVPVISGHKFHDRDRDGVRDPDEPGLAGWTMTLHRDRSDAGQSLGDVATTTTDANGYYEFRLDGHLPGDYAVTEENRTDWTRTTAERRAVHVGIGIGNPAFGGNDFGNVETKADAVKVSFEVLDPPVDMTADTEHPLRVRAVLENRGPAPVIDVQDTITASGPADCTFRPAQQAVTRRLVLGQPIEVVFDVGVTCLDPSDHPMRFDNALTVTTPGVTDPDTSSNQRTTTVSIAVIDEADVRIDSTNTVCAQRTYVRDHFECTVTTVVSNAGDYGPAKTDVTLGLTGPQDCVLTPIGSPRHDDVVIGEPTTVVSKWDVACDKRSFHDFAATSEVTLDHKHVIDPNDANNKGTAEKYTVEVFERVDLKIADIRITCSERQYQMQNFNCTTKVTVANAGPADAVATITTIGFTAPADCTFTPAGTQQDERTLNAGTSATFTKDWTVSCSEARRHTVSTSATIKANEPHPEDTDRANDTASISWQPIDVKPRSFPSSINLKKEGAVPVAILSTAEFNALTQVDRQSLTFGVIGTEASLVRCGSGEDVNDDGLVDLVCQFDTKKTGLTCGSTTATLMGRTVDGLRFEGQDDVKITGC
ncbi:hypothetical protein Lesp02_66120 [Lentzea sp. NBRC 105346]|uniref:SdrD B-like domain-containing protein n=1 Tax=Lentzea sp. NBRC 105346 TaxID=3032205 RepID=UPI0024A4F8B1|nr:SdrD B-like domain-containing protein [Lentzea sp. NBRC 105346]GLZ34425.1 hypothetical protein Lesp02_66120 [Lentzea sp. NBRC 105346]